jgi:hypothetical protein
VKLDGEAFAWRQLTGRGDTSYPVHHEMCLLGYDRDAGTLDLLIRFDDRGGHCHAHRHVCTTSVLVLEGEQHLDEIHPGGTGPHKVRRAGEHHLTTGDAYGHLERGGPEGALIFFSHHTTDGRLYESLDEQGRVERVVTLDSLIDAWESGAL